MLTNEADDYMMICIIDVLIWSMKWPDDYWYDDVYDDIFVVLIFCVYSILMRNVNRIIIILYDEV